MRHASKHIVGMLVCLRLSFAPVKEWRDGSQVHSKTALLRSITGCLCCGRRSNRRFHSAIETLSSSVRRANGLKHAPSTSTIYRTLRDASTEGMREVLHTEARTAFEHNLLGRSHLAGGMLVLDGKKVASDEGEPPSTLFRATKDPNGQVHWYVEYVRAVVVDRDGVICIEQELIPQGRGEASLFPEVVRTCAKVLGEYMPHLVSADALSASAANARVVREVGSHYLFHIKRNNHVLYDRMEQAFRQAREGHVRPSASTFDHINGKFYCRDLWILPAPAHKPGLPEAKQWWMVRRAVVNLGEETTTYEYHYFCTSAPQKELRGKRALKAVRLHWMIENGSNWTADVPFNEDKHAPCIKGNGVFNTSWLTMLAVNAAAMVRVMLSTPSVKPAWADVQDAILEALRDPDAWEEVLAAVEV